MFHETSLLSSMSPWASYGDCSTNSRAPEISGSQINFSHGSPGSRKGYPRLWATKQAAFGWVKDNSYLSRKWWALITLCSATVIHAADMLKCAKLLCSVSLWSETQFKSSNPRGQQYKWVDFFLMGYYSRLTTSTLEHWNLEGTHYSGNKHWMVSLR